MAGKQIYYRLNAKPGAAPKNLVDLMVEDIFDYRDTRILERLSEKYLWKHPKLMERCSKTIDEINSANYAGMEPFDQRQLCNLLLVELFRQTGKNLKYGLWLTNQNGLKNYHNATSTGLDVFPSSDYALTDPDDPAGVLYAYADMPKPLNLSRKELSYVK